MHCIRYIPLRGGLKTSLFRLTSCIIGVLFHQTATQAATKAPPDEYQVTEVAHMSM